MSSSLSSYERWRPESVLLITMSSLVVASNLIIVAAFTKKHLDRHPRFYPFAAVELFVFNISLFDILYSFGTTCGLLLSAGDLHRSDAATVLLMFFTMFGGAGSLFLLFGLALTRYKFVFDPNNKRYHTKNIRRVIIGIWIVFFVVAFVIAITDISSPAPAGFLSQFGQDIPVVKYINPVFTIFVLVVPCGGVFWFYRRILNEVKGSASDDKLTRRIARMFVLLNSVYFVTLLPYACLAAWGIVTGEDFPRQLDTWLYILTYCNWLANPIIYCACRQKYRAAVLDLPGIRYIRKALGYSTRSGSSLESGESNKSGQKLTSRLQSSVRSRTESECPDDVAACNGVATLSRKSKLVDVTDLSRIESHSAAAVNGDTIGDGHGVSYHAEGELPDFTKTNGEVV